MLNACHRCNLDMGNDNSGCRDEWPRPKKSKKYDDTPSWDCLPAAILDNVFQYLTFKDIINASSTCNNWRPSLYHPKLWQNVTFVIEPETISKVQYLRTMIGCMVTNATIRFNSMISSCVVEFLLLLDYFTCNNNLQSLILEPSHCHVLIPDSMLKMLDITSPAKTILKIISNNSMTKISLGCNEDLVQVSAQLLKSLTSMKPNNVTTLGLASVKEDPINYFIYHCDPQLFVPFRNLQILSIDYDNLNDDFLDALHNMNDLLRLVVHMHGIWEGHPGTSDVAWKQLRAHQPNCLLRLSLIHAYEEVDILHDVILKDSMPLSHLKVFFCESMNSFAMEKLIKYHDTFVSLMWVDSITDGDDHGAYCLLGGSNGSNVEEPQNLILIAWLCKKLEEIVILGYKYYDEDWLGVSRLRGSRLKRLEIAAADVLKSGFDIKEDLINIMGKTWAPLEANELHPVLLDPVIGDSDEYLMPILSADLQ